MKNDLGTYRKIFIFKSKLKDMESKVTNQRLEDENSLPKNKKTTAFNAIFLYVLSNFHLLRKQVS